MASNGSICRVVKSHQLNDDGHLDVAVGLAVKVTNGRLAHQQAGDNKRVGIGGLCQSRRATSLGAIKTLTRLNHDLRTKKCERLHFMREYRAPSTHASALYVTTFLDDLYCHDGLRIMQRRRPCQPDYGNMTAPPYSHPMLLYITPMYMLHVVKHYSVASFRHPGEMGTVRVALAQQYSVGTKPMEDDAIKARFTSAGHSDQRPNSPETTYLTTREAAQLLRVTERTVYRKIANGHLRRYRIGGRFLRFRMKDILNQIEEA